MFIHFRNWYNEFGGPSNITRDDFFLKASGVEIFLFYLNLLAIIGFCITICLNNNFHWRYLLFFVSLPLWMFLRSSRKDMSATANWVAAIVGAIGGGILVIASKLIK